MDGLNHSLVVLAKLDRFNKNMKNFIFLSLLLLSSCFKPRQYFHTEIGCPGKQLMLIRYTSAKEITDSIATNIANKKKNNTNENYTIIYAAGNRTLKLSISPEDMKQCSLREIPVLNPDKDLIRDID